MSSSSFTQVKPPLRSAMALAVKECIWRCLLRVNPTKRPIGIYASRRSGSSLLMEAIGVNPGIVYSDQPFGLYTASSATVNQLPVFPYGQVAYPDVAEEAILRRFVEQLLSGAVRPNYPWKVWRKEFHFFNDRVCLKITDAKTMIDWMESQFDVQPIVLTRHPIAQALSVSHVGWYPTGKGLLRNDGYIAEWLNEDLCSFCWDLYDRGTELEWRVVDWVLENLPLLRRLPSRPTWHYVSYEELVQDPQDVVQHLAREFDLPDQPSMIDRLREPSRSTRRESSKQRQEWIAAGDRKQLVASWQDAVTPAQRRACLDILDRFEIGLYSPDSPVPDRRHVRPVGQDNTPKSSTL